MLDLRQRIIAIIIGVLGVIIILGLAYVLTRADEEVVDTPPPGTVETTQPPAAGEEVEPPEETPGGEELPPPVQKTSDELRAEQTARVFVERFSTYSNQNDNVHIEDALTMATAKMATWINTQAVAQESVYAGQTTRVITTVVNVLTNNSAKIGVTAQQVQQSDTGTNTVYRTGKVLLVKQGDGWLVDGLFWDEQ